jgi:glycosyltransferase involved in cell wall biosynthesis
VTSGAGAGLSLCIVLSASKQTGGGYHQSMSNLRRALATVPQGAAVSVLDAKGSFRDGIEDLISQGELDRSQVVELPASLPSLADRVVSDSRLMYRLARALLALRGVHVKVSRLARFLDRSDFDLVFFASPAPEAADLHIKPYIWTLWDLCHLDSPEFPEVRTSGKFEAKEDFFSLALRKAALVLVDSHDLVDKAQLYYGIPSKKFVVVPFQAPGSTNTHTHERSSLPAAISPIAGRYFFYPAQLWTHKNHARIIQALHQVNQRGHNFHAVFVGKDHGAGNLLRERVASLGMQENVHFLGYVDDSAIPALYSNSIALVMASYFGPTNLPPLEALELKVPIISSSIHANQLRDAALHFDPDSAEELADHMVSVTDEKTRSRLLRQGERRLREIDREAATGLDHLQQAIQNLSKRLLR